MKYKIFDYSIQRNIAKLEGASVLGSFEVQPDEPITPAELLDRKFDVIEIDGEQYQEFTEFIPVVDWKTNTIASADCLIFKNNTYLPFNLLAETIVRILKKNVGLVNSQRPVIVIGNNYFIFSVVTELALSGFVDIIVSPIQSDKKETENLEKRIKKLFFNLNMKIVEIGDITSAEQNAFLMISNFPREVNKFAYELLIYFNYLSEGAVFIDCNSINDSSLVEDARKAEIFVIDEVEVLENKYDYLTELLKISP